MTIQSLEGETSGRYVVTTENGTKHLLDLDKRTLTRHPQTDERRWDTRAIGIGAITADGRPFRYKLIKLPVVGDFMSASNDFEWRESSKVISIKGAQDG